MYLKRKKKERIWFLIVFVYARFLKSKPTATTAMMMAMPMPTVYSSYGGFAIVVGFTVGVAAGAALTVTLVAADELPYESSAAKASDDCVGSFLWRSPCTTECAVVTVGCYSADVVRIAV